MVFDLNQIKTEVMGKVKKHVLPEATTGAVEFKLNSDYEMHVFQSFKPYSTAYRETTNGGSFPILLNFMKTGTPTGSVYVYLLSDSNGIPGSTITGRTLTPTAFTTSFTEVPFYMDLTDVAGRYLGSNTRYWFEVFTGNTIDPANYYSIQRTQYSISSDYPVGSVTYRQSAGATLIPMDADIHFRVSLPTWIYPDYPRSTISEHSYPRIAIDVLGRPRVDQPWISHRLAEYQVSVGVTVYSRYPQELDEIISYFDRGLWYDRLNLSGIRLVNPGNISNVSVPRQGIFVRTAVYTVTILEQAQNIL